MNRFGLYLLGGTLLFLLQIGSAHAQATRTWVSGVGDDANPCSRTAPCKTFAGAISKTATGGEINCLDSGGFGAVTIVKSITIDCGYTGGIAASFTTGIIVNATTPSATTAVVILRNFTINGYGTGIDGVRMLAGGALHLENLRIMGFTGKGINIATTNDCDVFVTDTTVTDSVGGGILFAPGAGGAVKGTVDSVRTDRNGSIASAAFGVKASSAANVTVTNSIAARNFGNGFETAVGGVMAVTFSATAFNSANGLASAGAIRIADVTITGNTTGLSGSINSFGNNFSVGNGSPGVSPTPVNPI